MAAETKLEILTAREDCGTNFMLDQRSLKANLNNLDPILPKAKNYLFSH
jgi:hypothetical protein